LKYYDTQKLFYNKYLYKITFYNDLNTLFRTEFQKSGSLSHAREKLDQLTESYRNGLNMQLPIYRTWKTIDETNYLDARHIYACLIRAKEDYRVRVESWGGMSVFSNNLSLLEKIRDGLHRNRRIEIHRPAENMEAVLLNNSNTIISKNPVCWPLKITMGNNRGNYSGFANWIHANKDKIKIGDKALHSLETHGYVNGYYFFIKSEKILNLISIMIGDNIRRIDRVVYQEDIDKY